MFLIPNQNLPGVFVDNNNNLLEVYVNVLGQICGVLIEPIELNYPVGKYDIFGYLTKASYKVYNKDGKDIGLSYLSKFIGNTCNAEIDSENSIYKVLENIKVNPLVFDDSFIVPKLCLADTAKYFVVLCSKYRDRHYAYQLDPINESKITGVSSIDTTTGKVEGTTQDTIIRVIGDYPYPVPNKYLISMGNRYQVNAINGYYFITRLNPVKGFVRISEQYWELKAHAEDALRSGNFTHLPDLSTVDFDDSVWC